MLETFNCPSCHASLDLPADPAQTTVKCPFCATTVIVPEELREPNKPAYQEPVQIGGQSSGCGCPVLISLLVLLVGAGAAYLFFQGGDLANPQAVLGELAEVVTAENLIGPALLLPVGDGALADVAFTSRSVENEEMYVNFWRGGETNRLWQSGPFADEVSNLSLFADDQHIYYVHEDEITALNRETGTAVWQTRLTDQLPYTCQGCVQTFSDQLVVLSIDETLRGLDAATGAQSWQQEMDLVTASGFMRFSDQPGLIVEDENSGMGLSLFDAQTGDLAQRLEPRCEHPVFEPQEPQHNAPVIFDEATQSFYIVFGFFDPVCVQRWNYETNTLMWSSFVDTHLNALGNGAIQDKKHLYFNGSASQLFAANKEDGAVRLLVEKENYNLLPLMAANDTLLVKATKIQGSRRDELWAIATDSGDFRWQHVPQADTMLEDGMIVVHENDEGYWQANATNTGVQLLQARHNPPRLVLETLSWQEGASSGQKDLPLNISANTSYWFHLFGWDGGIAWMQVNLNEMQAIDVQNATILADWP